MPAGFREVEVETGLISSDYVEIVSGDIEENDEVYVAESSVQGSAQDGQISVMMPGGAMPEADMGGPGGGSGGRSGGGPGGGSGGRSGGSSGGGQNRP